MKRLFLIDGHALIFRSYYAFLRRPMFNSKGVDTSILFGFTKTLIDLIIKERPTHLAVAFDPPAKTFRHELYPEYKANRSETPELIKKALEPLSEILEAISIPVIMKPGFEADDVIGTLAKRAEKEDFEVYMVTPDKDYGQLVSGRIFQYKPGKSGADMEVIGMKEICDYYTIERPEQVIDILTIWGDASDNVPGVRGVGEVGSKKLIQKYGSVENIYNMLTELPEKQQAAFREAEQHIGLSKRLITIDTNVDVSWDEDSLRLSTPHFKDLSRIFTEYEFSSLNRSIQKLGEVFEVTGGNSEAPLVESKSKTVSYRLSSPEEIISEARVKKEIAIKQAEGGYLLGCYDSVYFCSRERISIFQRDS